VPVIENIHQKLLEAIKSEGAALQMDSWHTDGTVNESGAYCGTTHCRAGWIVALAGKEGRDLEKMTTPEFAAMQIYHKSNPNIPVSPTRFYESNKVAMSDIERCAKEEAEANNNQA
jgi:hypothetical protein